MGVDVLGTTTDIYEKLKRFSDLERQLKKEFPTVDLVSAYQEMAKALESSDRATFSVEQDTKEGVRVLSYKGEVLGSVHTRRKLKNIIYDLFLAAGDPGKTKPMVEDILETAITIRAVQIEVTDTHLDKLDTKVDQGIFDNVYLEGKKISTLSWKDELKDQLRGLIEAKEAEELGPFVLVTQEREGYLLVEEGEGYRLRKLKQLPKPQQRLDDLSKIEGGIQKYQELERNYAWSIPFAQVLDYVRQQRPKGFFKSLLFRPNKYTASQMKGLEVAMAELLDLYNDTADITADIMKKYGEVIPGVTKASILRVMRAQTITTEYVGIVEWLTDPLMDFDGKHAAKMREAYEEQIDYSIGTQQQGVAAKYLKVHTDLMLEDQAFAPTSPEELVRGYKKALSTPGEEALVATFKVALANRMLSFPDQIPAIRKAGGFSSDELHQLVFGAYKSTALIKDMQEQQKNKDMKAFFEEYTMFWKGQTDDPEVGMKVNTFFNSFSRVHKIPFGNVRTAFVHIYPQGFDALGETLDETVQVQTALADFGLEAIADKGLNGAAWERMGANTNMTESQVRGWKQLTNIAALSLFVYQFVWKGLIKGEAFGGRWQTVAVMLGLQLGSQAMTGEGIISFGSKLLNGGLDEMDIMGFDTKAKKKTKDMLAVAKAHQDLLPAMGGSMLVGMIFGDFTKSEIAKYIEKTPSGYRIKDKQGLIAKHGKASYEAILLRKDDAQINTWLTTGLQAIDYDALPDTTKMGDIVGVKMRETVAEAERLEEFHTELAPLKNQLAPFTLSTTTQEAFIDTATHIETKARIEEMIAFKPKLDVKLIVLLPGLTATQQSILRQNHTQVELSLPAQKYMSGEITQDEMFQELADILSGGDGAIETEVLHLFRGTGTVSFKALQVAAFSKLIGDVQKTIEANEGTADAERGKLKLTTLHGNRLGLKSYRGTTGIDLTKRTIFVGGEMLELHFAKDEDLIKMANFINFALTKLEKKIKTNILSIDKEKPFSRSYVNISNVWKLKNPLEAGIEVDVAERWRWNVNDVEIISKSGLQFISSEFEANDQAINLLIDFCNRIYKAGGFN